VVTDELIDSILLMICYFHREKYRWKNKKTNGITYSFFIGDMLNLFMDMKRVIFFLCALSIYNPLVIIADKLQTTSESFFNKLFSSMNLSKICND